MKKMNKKKLMTFGIVSLFAIALVAAGAYYALGTFNLNINQPISIDGDLAQTVNCDAGDICLGTSIKISNSDNNNKVVTVTNNNANLDVDVGYMGKLRLVNKDLVNWNENTDLEATIYYTVLNDTFSWRYESSNGFTEGDYTLIYYKDNDANVDDPARLVTLGVDGGFNYYLPHFSDWNEGPDANYCGGDNGFDSYLHCKGAKLWLVPTDAITGTTVDWTKASGFLFETDLIWYSNTADTLTVPANSFIEFYPQFSVDEHTTGGANPIEITIA